MIGRTLLAGLLFAAHACAWFGTPVVFGQPRQAGAPGPPLLKKGFDPQMLGAGYLAPPHPSGAPVMELLEDDAGRLAHALNPGPDQDSVARAGAWAGDCYSGASCLKVAGLQRFSPSLAGWSYPVVQKPRPGEYRYLRFAWKRPQGRGIMLQIAAGGGTDWGRYLAGQNTVGFYPFVQVSPQPPRDWEVVTRDLFADFGSVPFTLTGLAFTSMDGEALFDHIYLGRTIEDLDRVTDAAKSWARRTEFLRPAQLDQLWKDMGSEDAAVRQPAIFTLAACGGTSVPYLAERIALPDVAAIDKRIAEAIAKLDSPRFAVRETASGELARIGATAGPQIEAALKRSDLSPEWRTRLDILAVKIRNADLTLTPDQARTLRIIHVLEQAESTEAKGMLIKLSKGGLEAGLSDEAKAALARMEKRRRQ
ncbi:MAG TPA: hypothetical protein VHR66_03280 [Gemmataceae bacterium]|jgi:hypothetical protein|nr:hypothetical protein [Gemmataceae bacterium]